jgi:flagellin
MGIRISTNVASMNAQNNLAGSQKAVEKSFAQLSSGSRITKAADDAAGLAISEHFKSQIRGFRQATRNANDGISLLQVAEGGMNEIGNMLTRLRELGVQAASDTVGDKERGYINKEVMQLTSEMQRITNTTRFGDKKLIDGTGGKFDFQVDIGNKDGVDRVSFDASEINTNTSNLGVEGLDYSSKEGAQHALETIDKAQDHLALYRSNLGAIQNRLMSTTNNLGTATENLSAANSRIRDTDVAEATAELTRNNILLSAGTATLQQANQIPQMAMKLIG